MPAPWGVVCLGGRVAVALPFVIPKSVAEEARTFARDTVTSALQALGHFVESELERRRSAAFAHEKALIHERLLVTWGRRVRWHRWRAAVWGARAWARDRALAVACGLKCA